jgi:NADH dehydrogenase/NADH:ubiquinone oxidoreductase subunit G
MMNNLQTLHQDETLRSKRLKQPAAKAAKQAENEQLNQHNQQLQLQEIVILKEKLKQHEQTISELKEQNEDLKRKVASGEDNFGRLKQAINHLDKDFLLRWAEDVFYVLGEEQNLDRMVVKRDQVLISKNHKHTMEHATFMRIEKMAKALDKDNKFKYASKKICRELLHSVVQDDYVYGRSNADSFFKEFPIVNTAFKGNLYTTLFLKLIKFKIY